MLSLPIPDDDSPITYRQIASRHPKFEHVGQIVEHLTAGVLSRDSGAHLDPDLDSNAIQREIGWKPIFGQVSTAQTQLQNCGVGAGDLFLFFGWFRRTEIISGKLRFEPGAPDIHVLFGWMSIGEVIKLGAQPTAGPPWATYHPHFFGRRDANNTLYAASELLTGTKMPGAGVFTRYSTHRQLTAIDRTRSLWRLPEWFDPDRSTEPLSYHENRARWTVNDDHVLLQTVGRGQEFVFDTNSYPEAIDWVASLLQPLD